MNGTPSLRRLTPDDRPDLDAFLDGHRMTSVHMRYNLFRSGLKDGPEPGCGVYVGAFAGDALTDVAAHYRSYSTIILQAPTRPAELALAAARESGHTVNGLLGPWPQVKAAEQVLEPGRTRRHKVKPVYLYRVVLADLAVPDSLSAGRVVYRRARDGDLATLVPWQREFDLQVFGMPERRIDDAKNRDALAGKIETKRLWVLEEAGCLVSMSGLATSLPDDMVKVGPVFTPLEARGRGYGRAVVAGSLLDAREAGAVEAVLLVDAENRAAQRAYEALGFEWVADYGLAHAEKEESAGE